MAERTTGAGIERWNRWRRIGGPGPPLYPLRDGSQCTGMVLQKPLREWEKFEYDSRKSQVVL